MIDLFEWYRSEYHWLARLAARFQQQVSILILVFFKVMGLKIFGSPWQPDFSQSAFSLQRGEQLRDKWEDLPLNLCFCQQSFFSSVFLGGQKSQRTQKCWWPTPPLWALETSAVAEVGEQVIKRVKASDFRNKHINYYSYMIGCEDLLERVARVVKPKLHVFGHIHEGEVRESLWPYILKVKQQNQIYLMFFFCQVMGCTQMARRTL